MKCLGCLVVSLALAAQDPRFGVQSRLVLVPATVSDPKGHSIDGLEAKDFVVLDNGRPQQVTVDTTGTGVAPIALVVAIQTSGISKPVLEKVRKVGAMIQPVIAGEGGCAAVVSFSERVDWVQECSDSDALVARAFEQLRMGEPKSARMLDAVSQAIERLRQHSNARRVLLLISESRDRGSEAALDQVAKAAQTADVAVYAATYSAFKTAWTTKSSATAEPKPPKVPMTPSEQTGTLGGGPPACNPNGCPDPPMPGPEQRVDILGGIGELARLGKVNTTQTLTMGTGGATFPFTRLKGLEEAIQKLGAELHSQYLISFAPDDLVGGYHRLEIRVPAVDARVRARPGYWSTQSLGKSRHIAHN